MNKRNTIRKPDSLFLLVLVVGVGMVISTGVSAADTLFSKAGFSELLDGNMKLARVGNQGAGLHMSFKSPSRENNALYVSRADKDTSNDRGVHLSVQIPW